MTENLNLALQLLLVGMLSVFFILGIVVALGRTLIYLVNKFSPEIVKPQFAAKTKSGFSKEKLAVLTAVVEVVTENKGVIKSVKKIN